MAMGFTTFAPENSTQKPLLLLLWLSLVVFSELHTTVGPDTKMYLHKNNIIHDLRCDFYELFGHYRLLWKLPDAENKEDIPFQKPSPSFPNPSLLDPLLLWPRRVKEGASEGGVLALMIRERAVNPRTRPQTKGSAAAPPTAGSRLAPPAPARGGLWPAFLPGFGTCSRTAGSAHAPRSAHGGFLTTGCPSVGPFVHLPSEHVLLSSPADAAGGRGTLLPVLRCQKPAFGARCSGPDLLRRRLGPRRLGKRGLGLAGRALRPERHAAQPHEVGLETQPPASPHRRRQKRAARDPRRGSDQRQNLRRPEKMSGSNKPFVGFRRLQDRQRAGAGNYKSNPSSPGVKLQRKWTSKEKRACMQQLGGFPCAPGTDLGKLQKSPERRRQANKSRPQNKRRVHLWAHSESHGAATCGQRLQSRAAVRGARG
ncbi:uncharacterized protein LOC110596604 [Carlito syrichta]|uniref:Uncharacterized protein LOC110596604 n=1 Tax=Carlito syrichta TaxID=1868482 RepID=A0A3Q0EH92_CARSF|nr:uncharacterized protein LOC110596604 [Carlito syrichta]